MSWPFWHVPADEHWRSLDGPGDATWYSVSEHASACVAHVRSAVVSSFGATSSHSSSPHRLSAAHGLASSDAENVCSKTHATQVPVLVRPKPGLHAEQYSAPSCGHDAPAAAVPYVHVLVALAAASARQKMASLIAREEMERRSRRAAR